MYFVLYEYVIVLRRNRHNYQEDNCNRREMGEEKRKDVGQFVVKSHIVQKLYPSSKARLGRKGEG